MSVHFNAVVVEDVVVEAGEETDLVVAVGFAILAVAEIWLYIEYEVLI